MNENNNDKIKKAMEKEPVPTELSPENIKTMLDEHKTATKKRSRIKVGSRIAAGAAACAVIGASAVYLNNNGNLLGDKFGSKDKSLSASEKDAGESKPENSNSSNSNTGEENNFEAKSTGSYMSGASDYDEIYQLFSDSYERYQKRMEIEDKKYNYVEDDIVMEEAADESYNSAVNSDGIKGESATEAPSASTPETNGGSEEEDDYYQTHNQEENVLEADVVKTDGKHIYQLNTQYSYEPKYTQEIFLQTTSVENGKFTGSSKISIDEILKQNFADADGVNVGAEEMYFYNDMLAIVGTVYHWNDEVTKNTGYYYSSYYNPGNNDTFVMFFTAGDEPELIDTYYQNGSYNDVRISPDGYLYLVSSYSCGSCEYIEEENFEEYIPTCGMSECIEYVPAGDILLPDELQEMYGVSYTLVSSINLNESGSPQQVQTKALAGYTGQIYASADNMYTAYGWDDTDITRIAINAGEMTPAASATVEGRVKDQFSMSEYNGFFRVATTKDSYEETYHSYNNEDDNDYWWEDFMFWKEADEDGYYTYDYLGRDNRLYVLDLDLNEIGSVKGFGEDEEIKSVSYSGETAYVVTYRQTDPLFSIDLSNPAEPVILDELEMPGYSTYMQQWEDGKLFGFGVVEWEWAEETGSIPGGIKLAMFDNSDPNNLSILGEYVMRGEETDDFSRYINSFAQWERKALMIAPEKNLIGVPVESMEYRYDYNYNYYYDYEESHKEDFSYMFFSYEDGEFVQRGKIEMRQSYDYNSRAMYIGDYIYVASGNEVIAADINTFEITDRVEF